MNIDAESIVKTITERCAKEKTSGLQVPLENVAARVSYYTGLPKTTVEQHELEISGKHAFLGAYDRLYILQFLHELYKANAFASALDIYEKLQKVKKKENQIIPHFVFFKRELTLLGFEHRKLKNVNQRILIEDPEIAFRRHDYLNKIREYRKKNRIIYYVEERIVDTRQSFEKMWVPIIEETPKSVDGTVFINVITKNSYVNGMFCSQLTSEEFNKYISEFILPQMESHSVLVMDDNPIHCKKAFNSISKYSSKVDMIKWLQRNGIPYNLNMGRSDLYKLIMKLPVQDDLYEIDYIIKAAGHDVLRLPLMIHDLVPNDCMWKYFKESFGENILNEIDFKDNVLSSLKMMPQTLFLKFDEWVIERENMLVELDSDIEKCLEKLKLDI